MSEEKAKYDAKKPDTMVSDKKKTRKAIALAEESLDEFKSVTSLQKKIKIIMDTNAIPEFMTPRGWAEAADSGYVFYDSKKSDIKPAIHILDGDVSIDLPRLVDTKGEQINIDALNLEFEIQEHWRKELWKCRKSPTYYFTHYLSHETRASQTSIEEFKASIGLSNDLTQEEAAKVLASHAKVVDLAHIQSLKPGRDALDQEWANETKKLQATIAKQLKTKPSNDTLVKRRIITAIVKLPISKAVGELEYYAELKKEKWDKQMLEATDLEVLLRLYRDIK